MMEEALVETPTEEARHEANRWTWSAITNLTLVVAGWFLLRWYTEAVYKHDPLSMVPPSWLETVADWILGYFILSVVTAASRGQLRILDEPGTYFNKDVFGFLGRPRSSVLLLLFMAILVACVWLKPAVHLTYGVAGEKPIIEKGSHWIEFSGDRALVFNEKAEDASVADIVIRDRHDVYRVPLEGLETASYGPILAGHQELALENVFVHKGFSATLSEPGSGVRIDSFVFDYKNPQSLQQQCADQGFYARLPNGDCRTFFRNLLDEIAAQNRFERDIDDPDVFMPYEGRRYYYQYVAQDPIQLHLRVEDYESYFADNPTADAFEHYWRLTGSERAEEAGRLRRDVQVMRDSTTQEVFKTIWSSTLLDEFLKGDTPREQMAALSFVADILSLGSDYVEPESVQDRVNVIAENNFLIRGRSGSLHVAAGAAILGITVSHPEVRSHALDLMRVFFDDVGTQFNDVKGAWADILLESIEEPSQARHVEAVIKLVRKLHESSRSRDSPYEEEVHQVVHRHLVRAGREELKRALNSLLM